MFRKHIKRFEAVDRPWGHGTKKRKRAEPQEPHNRTFKDGAICLYRRAEYKKPMWFIRLMILGAKGCVWKSSRGANEYVVYKAAEDLYNQLQVKVLSGTQQECIVSVA